MSTKEIFRTEFKGYNKKEVANYIMTLNSQMEQLKNELNRCESELSKYKAELSDDQVQSIRESLREEVKEEVYAQLRSEQEINAQPDTADDELTELRHKAKMYDEQKELLAEIMIKAKTDASLTVEEAQKKSKKLMLDTFDKFTKLSSDYDEMRKNIAAAKTEMDTRITAVRHYLNDFSQYLDFISQDIKNTGDNFKQNM